VSLDSAPDFSGALRKAALGAAESALSSLTNLATGELRAYEYRGEYAAPDINPGHADVALQQYRRHAILGGGESVCRRMGAGYRFSLETHAFPTLAREYVLTEVEHEGHAAEYSTSSAHDGHRQTYKNRFRCAPSEVPYRPKRPKKRRFLQVLESAKV